MELQKTKHQLRLEEWKDRVQACRNSGMTIKNWCAEHGIREQTYYRWQKLVWEAGTQSITLACAPAQSVTFAEYQSPVSKTDTPSGLVVHLACGRVEIPNGADRETIAFTLEALKALC